jgi:signal transduction histidine kinase/ligand-binding sensor domain-containing protein/DNA-binding response OmpR family regulator
MILLRSIILTILQVVFISVLVSGQQSNIRFGHLTTNDGLSQSTIYCIYQDSRGFLWFGTRDGLNKFDGYKFTVYRNDPADSASLSYNIVKSIKEDSNGNLWIGTLGGGLNKFDRNSEKFSRYNYSENNAQGLSSDLINCLIFDHAGNIWIGTSNGGLNLFEVSKNKFTYYKNDKFDEHSLSDNDVRAIYEDDEQNLWVATNKGGLNLLNRASKKFTRYKHSENSNSLSHNSIWSVIQDKRKNLWVGTYGGGLDLLDRKTKVFMHYKNIPGNKNSLCHNVVVTLSEDHQGNLYIGTENGGLSVFDPSTATFNNYTNDEGNTKSLSSNSINSLYCDVKGNMWIGTFNGAINFVNLDAGKFIHYKHNPFSNSLSNNKVLSIFEDSKDNLWIGTDGGGLDLFDRKNKTFIQYKHEEGNKNSICGNYVLRVYEDSDGNLWVGTWADGITVFNREKNTFKHFKNDPSNPLSLNSNNCWGFFEDSEKNIWIGTLGGGLNRFNKNNATFTHFMHDDADPYSIGSNKVYSIYEDRNGDLLIGTDEGGLNIFNKKTGRFTKFKNDKTSNSVSSNSVDCILQDKDGNLWLGTDVGLDYFDRKNNHFTTYLMKDGLPNEVIQGILPDERGNLWISTNKGISKFNIENKTFKNYSTVDGLQEEEFKEEAYCKSRSGAMYFGGINGFNEFFPDNVNNIPFDPPILLTNFQIFNQEVPLSDDPDISPLRKSITETQELTLPYKKSVFSFEFASLNFTVPQKNQYKYMLEGFDNDWNIIGTKHTATYTNLDPGKYKFKVKGLDNEGNWSKQTASIMVTITPPFWLTWWFKTFSVLFIAGSFFGFFWIRNGVAKRQRQELVRQVKERTEGLALSNEKERKARYEAEKARQEAEAASHEAEKANRAKSIFLATMSHEIRTPMNGVIGMASLLSETSQTGEQQEYTETIRSCGENLLGVINDILDFSKIESGNMELEHKDLDLRASIEEVLDVFAGKAAKIGLDLIYEIDENVPLQIIGDSLRLRQILMNLVSNAIKFTQQGEVFIGVHLIKDDQGEIELGFEVRDTGIGIPDDKLGRLFKAFSQVDSSTTRKYGGTGLGLVICEKLIELMGGFIAVESQVGVGTTFTFNIQANVIPQASRNLVHPIEPELAGKKILVIDDNSTNLTVFRRQLEQWNLKVTLARSAQDALSVLAAEQDFALIITDMQMPEMDGIHLAQRVRQNNNKIPIILLSFVGDERIKEYQHLFSSIITKPVRQATLKKHIVTQLTQQTAEGAVVESKKMLTEEFSERFPMNILITEDNHVNQRLAERVLTKLGYKPDKAFNGQEALDALTKKHFDIILMDVQMPVMDGMEATQKIRQQGGAQPVIIAMTANAMQGDREKCMDAGMNDYISKPIKLEDLVNLLEKWSAKSKIASKTLSISP